MPLNPAGAVDVPLSLFSGLNTELAPPDVPEGVAPDNGDVAYLPGSVFSRPATRRILKNAIPGNPAILYEKTYVQPNGNPFTLILDATGALWSEDVVNTPGVIVSIGQVAPGSLAQSVTAFGREYIAFSDGNHGADIPRQFDGTYFDRVSQDGPGAAPSFADSVTAGAIAAGTHQAVVMFLTRQGYITKPSPIASWNAAGSKKVSITNIPIGPPNVIARIIAFTGAGGSNFFYIPTTTTFPTSVSATVIFDNTSTAATMDFADNALFAATAIDIPGNNLFAQVVLGPALGVSSYASRMLWWGEHNKIQNFLNMGFEGGIVVANQPLGWTLTGAGLLVPGDSGLAWQITGDASANNIGLISQSAYQDGFGVPIVQPNTVYKFRCWAKVSAANLAGSLFCDLQSGSIAALNTPRAQIMVTKISTQGAFVEGVMNLATPGVIPADLLLRIYENGLANAATVAVDECELIPLLTPYLDNTARFSYVNNPEAFDGSTGNLGPAGDPAPIRCFSTQRGTLYLKTLSSAQSPGGVHSTQDNGTGEPSTWTVNPISRSVGALSFRATDAGQFGTGDGAEDWDITASRGGLYIFNGGDFYKVSQEIQNDWEAINWAAQQSIWVKNDTVLRRAYVGIPTGANLSPNKILVLDYRELDTASQIANSSPIHISFTGKMIASDLARKWTRWNLASSTGEILARPGNVRQFSLGGNGNIYFLDPTRYTDDDFGAIASSYTTYFFVNHEMEQQLGVGSHRKLYVYLSLFVAGVGTLQVTPLVDSLSNAMTPMTAPLVLNPANDLEFGLNITGERVAFKIQAIPLDGQTDNYFNLEKMVVTMKPEPMAPVRGAL